MMLDIILAVIHTALQVVIMPLFLFWMISQFGLVRAILLLTALILVSVIRQYREAQKKG